MSRTFFLSVICNSNFVVVTFRWVVACIVATQSNARKNGRGLLKLNINLEHASSMQTAQRCPNCDVSRALPSCDARLQKVSIISIRFPQSLLLLVSHGPAKVCRSQLYLTVHPSRISNYPTFRNQERTELFVEPIYLSTTYLARANMPTRL